MKKDSAYYAQRLRENANKAAVEYARIEQIHADAVERGVDTSIPTPAKSLNQSLAQAKSAAEFTQRELDRYLTEHGLVEGEQ